MKYMINTKKQALKVFGTVEKAVIAMNITRTTWAAWPEILNDKQRNTVLGAAINNGYKKCK